MKKLALLLIWVLLLPIWVRADGLLYIYGTVESDAASSFGVNLHYGDLTKPMQQMPYRN